MLSFTQADGLAGRILRKARAIFPAMKTQFAEKPYETIAAVSITIVLLLFAVFMQPVLKGDGQYYYGMLYGLAEHGSPEISEHTARFMADRYAITLNGLVFTSHGGDVYAYHFFFYPLICVPAYYVTSFLGLDTLQSFQITNALIVSGTIWFLLFWSNLKAEIRWFLSAAFLFSTGTIYFQWTHPEIFSAAALLVSSVLCFKRSYASAALFAALSSLQNPSSAFLIPVILLMQAYDLADGKIVNLVSRTAVSRLVRTVACASVTLLPYAYFFALSGTPSAIADSSYIDGSLITVQRLSSFLFDLNQGLIIGMPMLLWIVPGIVIYRAIQPAENRRLLRREDLLILAFLIVIAPTLAQRNWNGGHSVFLRYGAWAGMILVAWAGITLNAASKKAIAMTLVPAVMFQIVWSLCIGGLAVPRLNNQLQFQPWVPTIWSAFPKFYNPEPEIFHERTHHREIPITLPSIFRDKDGTILRVLSDSDASEELAMHVCGEGSTLFPIDGRRSSQLRFTKTRSDLIYATGRLKCLLGHWDNAILSFAAGEQSLFTELGKGWSKSHTWGTWNNGKAASLKIFVDPENAKAVKLGFSGRVFVREAHPQQSIKVTLNGVSSETWDFVDKQTVSLVPDVNFVTLDASVLRANHNVIDIQFVFADAVSPQSIDYGRDRRLLALGLSSIRISKIEQ